MGCLILNLKAQTSQYEAFHLRRNTRKNITGYNSKSVGGGLNTSAGDFMGYSRQVVN